MTGNGSLVSTTGTRLPPVTNISVATWQSGNKEKAVTLATVLLRDQERVLGASNPETERTRRSIATWTAT
jgi:hypothetical protein